MTARRDGTGRPDRWQILRGTVAGWILGHDLWCWLRRQPWVYRDRTENLNTVQELVKR